jgi:hypothetical protein
MDQFMRQRGEAGPGPRIIRACTEEHVLPRGERAGAQFGSHRPSGGVPVDPDPAQGRVQMGLQTATDPRVQRRARTDPALDPGREIGSRLLLPIDQAGHRTVAGGRLELKERRRRRPIGRPGRRSVVNLGESRTEPRLTLAHAT